MKKILLVLVCLLAAVGTQAYRKPKFKPFEIPGLEQRPAFWKVRPAEIIDICKSVKKGRAEVVAKTPLGYPVYAVFYGDFSEPAPQSNWSASGASSSMAAYLGPEKDVQTLMFIAGVHGSEPESVAAAANIITLLETGKDLRGKEDPEFLELALKYRIIIMPCVNMDGRLISPDHFHGQPYEVFRAGSQGTWKDGSLIGWKGSKEWFPLPLDKVQHPGGYPNSEGYNIQHDVAPGAMKTAEARAICNLMSRWRVDFCLNGHSCEYQPFVREPSIVESPGHIARGGDLSAKINLAFFEAGLTTSLKERKKNPQTLNLTNLTNWCSGGLGMTLECSHSYDNVHKPTLFYSFDQLMEPVFLALKVVMRDGLKEPLAARDYTHF